jgi:hypothetical protein
MGRDAGRTWSWSLLAALAVAVLATTAPPPVAAATPKTSSTKLAQTAHVAFWDCPAKTTEILVVVNTLTLHPGAPLDVSFTVRNAGKTPCNYTAPYAGVTPGPTTTALTAGPCGSVGFQIDDPHHHDVWPSDEVVNCPALGFAQLAAGATVSGTGAWDQDKPNSTHRVAPGTYTLLVQNKRFSFTLHVAKS